MAYPFAAAEVLTAVDLNAMIGAPTQNTQTGTTYTFGLADAGKVNTFDNASPVTATLPAQATVSWPANTVLPVLCLGAGTVTITAAAGVTINGTPLTLATSKGGSLVRTASNTWTFIPFSGGVEAANFTNTATGTYTDGGIDYKYITFTGSGSLVIDRAGECKLLVLGGGCTGYSAGSTWAGKGGYSVRGTWQITAATYTVTIGGPGAVTANILTQSGNDTSIGTTFIGFGGGAGGTLSAGSKPSNFNDDITGTSITYAEGAVVSVTANRGQGGQQALNTLGSEGVVVVAVKV